MMPNLFFILFHGLPMSQTAQPFNPLSIAISGTNLIEASAGTGKTYGIAALFTRLVVLEQMPVESVLVVTFTKAATAELKTRLRARLDDVLQVLENVDDAAENPAALDAYCDAEHSGDAFLRGLLEQALAQETQARLIVRLKAAINDFDNAAIYTIHGFCQRVLRDYAFLCNAPFDVELSDQGYARLAVPAEAFWRERISHNAEWAELVFRHRYTPQKALAAIQSYTNRPYLSFRRPEDTYQEAEQALQQTWQKVSVKLAELEAAFWRIHPDLNGNAYRKNTFTDVFAKLKQAVERNSLPDLDSKLLDNLAKFAADVLAEKLKKGKSADAATLADLQTLANFGRDWQNLAAAEENRLILLQLDLLDYVNRALAEQKKSRRERGFDDLLLDVHHALTDNPQAAALAEAVAANWRVALIDEFQDTDPLQYEIFKRIFIQHARPLFLVGDPKQAIYSFRGADIYAYLQAAADADHHYTLAVNYRSHAALIQGIGALFQQKNRPFVLEHIDYSDVGAAREHSRLNPPRIAIQVRWLNEGDAKLPNKDVLRRRAAEYCADEIAAALNDAAEGRLNIGARPLVSGDIAVLVRTHGEGSIVAKALKQRRIQSVLLHRESVFAAPEAQALAALLGFWLNPRHTESLRFVLAGVLFGYDADTLYALNQNEAALLDWIAAAQEAAERWQRDGFYAAAQAFAAAHGIETRLLQQGSSRSLTNYHQLLERLAEEDEQSRSPAALHQWLNAQISAALDQGMAGEDNILRLESDEALVKIVTMHASKGLQYPLVFCPFVWDAADTRPSEWQILHEHGGHTELLAKNQLTETDETQLADEEMAERLRLLYVALTRAEEQLTIYAAHCDNTADNTFAYLLEGTPESSRDSVRATYKAEKSEAQAAMLKANWQRFIDQAPTPTDFAWLTEAPLSAALNHLGSSKLVYQAADIPARPFRFVRHTSFTGLSSHTAAHAADAEAEVLQPTLDRAETTAQPSETALPESDDAFDIYHFPRGTQAGLCLHDALENLDFNRSAAEQSDALAAVLARYGFEEHWLPALITLADCCRETPLGSRHTLSDIPARARLAEMGFTLYMHDFRLPHLRAWLTQPHLGLPQACIDAAAHLDFKDLQGFLNGFIDMVCQDSDGLVYVIDYKSNHLGNHAEAYTPEAMDQAMAEHHYYLQALIYAIAVARYFKLRGQPLPKIAVRYLFLRGMNGTENGIWQWDIDTADLAEWL